MKKLITIILLLALITPMAALADRDPIVGSYYALQDYKLYPETAPDDSIDMIIMVLTFYEDGTIMNTENDISGRTGKQVFSSAGKWEKTDTGYKISLIGLGEGEGILEEDAVLIPLQNFGHLRLHKLITLNPYKDYVLNY